MTSPFMERIAALLAARGIAVYRFEFAYMAARRRGGKRRPPPKAEALMPEFIAAIADVEARDGPEAAPLFVGGKSMGGRVASMIVDELHRDGRSAGCAVLGYPFHPPGMPEKLRTAHLEILAAPMLIVQGERDPFGSRAEVETLTLSPSISFVWATDGDHDLGPRGGQGVTRSQNLEAAADAISEFAGTLEGRR